MLPVPCRDLRAPLSSSPATGLLLAPRLCLSGAPAAAAFLFSPLWLLRLFVFCLFFGPLSSFNRSVARGSAGTQRGGQQQQVQCARQVRPSNRRG